MDQEELLIAEPPVEPISSYRDESGYVPLVLGLGPTGNGSGRRSVVQVDTVVHYEELAAHVELTTQQLLRDHHYNTLGNFLRFYSAYAQRKDRDVNRLYREYQPPITPAHHTCVGLGLTLQRQLSALPGSMGQSLRDALHLVSCEEAVENPAAYLREVPCPDTSEKEHVLVAARINIGGRKGVLVLDPGYHVARVVTVMSDGLYPHTGWFTQSDEPEVRREYMYTMSPDEKYVLWTVRETRGERQSLTVNLVYIERPYLSAVDVTERRNIVYNFRSLLARNTKGHLTAGVYFPLAVVSADSGPACTVFYTEVVAGANVKRRVKIPFHHLLDPTQELEVEHDLALVVCSQQLGMYDDGLEELLTKTAHVMADATFMKQVLDINNAIEEMSDDN